MKENEEAGESSDVGIMIALPRPLLTCSRFRYDKEDMRSSRPTRSRHNLTANLEQGPTVS